LIKRNSKENAMRNKPGPKPKPENEKSWTLSGVSVPGEMKEFFNALPSPSAFIQRLIRNSAEWKSWKS
jgi:hypothetical protein